MKGRLGRPKLIDGWNMLILLLPGLPTSYCGEEIGMQDTEIAPQQVRDSFAFDSTTGSLKPVSNFYPISRAFMPKDHAGFIQEKAGFTSYRS